MIQRLADEKARQVAFIKRKNGLFKRAMELSVLCDCEVAVVILNPSGKLHEYVSSQDMERLLEKYTNASREPHEKHTNSDVSGCFLTYIQLQMKSS